MLKLLKYFKNYKKQCIIAPLFKFLEACFEIVIPIIMKVIIDKGINFGGTADKTLIIKLTMVMLAMGILGFATALIAQYFSAVAGMGIGTELRKACYKHLGKLTNADVDKMGSSTVINRLTNDVNHVSTGVNRFLRLFLRSPFIILGTVVMSFVLDVTMGLIVLASIPLILLIVYLIGRFTVPRYTAVQRDTDSVALATKENLEGVRVIRAFSKQASERERFNETTDKLHKKQVNVSFVAALLNPLTYAIANIAIVCILYFGGGRVNSGSMTDGEITTLVNYIFQILNAVIALSGLVTILAKAKVSANRVSAFLSTTPSFTDEGNTIVEPIIGADKIAFEGVTFSYNQNKTVLEDITFQVKGGQTIGVIGGTGSGKSTLVNLIPRLYEVDSGCVYVDGVDVKKYPFTQLRSKIAIAVQHATLFKGTIRDNLLFANPTATEEQMISALKLAQAYNFVFEKKGLDTPVARGGANFSGGQKQRLNVARALVSNPEILILDDSSSALDYATDLALRTSLKTLKDLTVIIISQRVASVMQADKIIILEDGCIEGIGTHEELYQTNAVYQEIYNSQTKENGNE